MAKKMTIEDLGGMVKRGFDDVQIRIDTLATKEELHEVRDILSNAIKDLEMRMSAYMSFNKEELDRLKSWMQTIEERVAFLEQKYKHKK